MVDVVSFSSCSGFLCIGDETGAGRKEAVGVPDVVRGLGGDDREGAFGLKSGHGVLDIVCIGVNDNRRATFE